MTITKTNDVRSRMVQDYELIDDSTLETLIFDTENFVIGPEYDLQEIDEDRLKYVVSRVILRYIRNPEGIRQAQETTGPSQVSRTYSGDRLGELYLTDDDRDTLVGRSTRPKAFTISLINHLEG